MNTAYSLITNLFEEENLPKIVPKILSVCTSLIVGCIATWVVRRILFADSMNFSWRTGRTLKTRTEYSMLWAGKIPPEAEEVLDIFNYPDVYGQFNSQIPMGVLLVGLPGTGKTYFANVLSRVAEAAFFHASGSQFDELLVGRGPQRIRRLFEEAAAWTAPTYYENFLYYLFGVKPPRRKAVIFIDEIDALGCRSTRGWRDPTHATLSQLLTCMDGLTPRDNIFVIAATNSIDHIDPALKRSGRFDRIIEMPMPEVPSRYDLLLFYLREKLTTLCENDLREIANQTDKFSCADMKKLVDEGVMCAVRETIEKVKKDQVPKNSKIVQEAEKNNVITRHHLDMALKTMLQKLYKEKPALFSSTFSY